MAMETPGVMAVVGSRSALGSGLMERWEAETSVRRILAFDLRPPRTPSLKVAFHRVDLTQRKAEDELARIFEGEGVSGVVHLALLGSPLANAAYARELEVEGTSRVIAACERAGISHLLFRSTTAVYGAHPRNPARLTEASPRRVENLPFLTNKRDAEDLVLAFAERHPDAPVAVLRFAPELGPGGGNVAARYLLAKVAITLAGRDPLVQVVQEEDAIGALYLLAGKRVRGVYNVAPPGALPLSSALRILSTPAVPLPTPLAAAALRALGATGLLAGGAPEALDFLRYSFVADGGKMEREVGFRFRYGVREALETGRKGQ